MKNKKILYIFIILMLFVSVVCGYGFSNRQYDVKENELGEIIIDEDSQIINVISSGDTLYNLSDPNVMQDLSDYVALVKIDSIDGADNVNKKTGNYVSTYTYGKATILKMLKGNIASRTIGYTRSGGKILYSQWVKGQASPEKIKKLVESTNNKSIDINNVKVYDKFSGDIDLEVGKIYLVYMYHEPTFNNDNEFVIHGFQYGMREAKMDSISENTLNNVSDIKIKNNDTGKWENLSTIINTEKK